MVPVCLDNHPEHPDWVGVFEEYKELMTEVPKAHKGTADKQEALESLRVAIMLLDIHPGQRVSKVMPTATCQSSAAQRGRFSGIRCQRPSVGHGRQARGA